MLEVIQPPASLADQILQSVCDHLRRKAVLESGDSPPNVIAPTDLDHIRRLTETAVAKLDGPKGIIGRALLTQRWSVWLDCFPPVIELPIPPLQTITCIKYVDINGDWQTLPSSAYRVSGAQSWRPEIAPAHGETWPSTRNVRQSVEVRIRVGYGDTADDVPEELLQAIRLLVAHYYKQRELVVFSTPHVVPHQINDLIQPYRIYR